jgi:hypothetical protein
MLRIFTAPISEPGLRTLQADAETWQALIKAFPRDDMPRYTALATAVRNASGEKVKRVTLPDELARYVLSVAGISG